MRFYTIFAALICFSLLNFQCGESDSDYKGTVIKGKIDGAANLKIFLDKMMLNNTADIIDKVEIDGSGNFKLKVEHPVDMIYRLRIGAKQTLVLAKKEDDIIELNGQLANFQSFGYELKASEEALEFQDMMKNMSTRQWQSPQVLSFIQSAKSPLSAMFASMMGVNPEQNLDLFKNILVRLNQEIPDSQYAKDYGNIIAQTQMKLSQQKIKLGEEAPEISEASPSGKNIALSSLRGQVVLIDFWASWCGPCRRNNPKLVALYKKYKDQGFTIYSVSLDKKTQKNRWEAAIEKDNLIWPYHVSDLKGWSCAPAKLYGVRSIPQTFLLDREGNIAAINPHGADLDQKVGALLKES